MGLFVQRVQLCQQLALGERQLHLRLLAPQTRLLQFAAIRSPVPDRQLQRGGGGVSQIAHCQLRNRIELASGEMVGVNPVKIIQFERRQEARPGRANFLPRFLQCAHRGSQLGILPGGRALDFGEWRKWLGSLQIVHHSEMFVEVREDEHRQLQPAAIHFQL